MSRPISIHHRSYETEAFDEGNGTMRLVGRLVDTKPQGLGMADGEPLVIHDMIVEMIVAGDTFEILDITTTMQVRPYGQCTQVLDSYQQLVGVSIARGYSRKVKELFGQTPTVFRNTELMYHDDLAWHIAKRGEHRAILCEGVDRLLKFRSPNYCYVPPRFEGQPEALNERPVKLLLKNYRLSDDVAFRFGNRDWKEYPLSAEKFAKWVNDINGDGNCCNLFMDYETIGEHQWADTGIFEFLDALPEKIYDINPGQNDFLTPSQVLDSFEPVGEYAAPNWVSWADTERDLSAWLGNPLQDNAVEELYAVRDAVYARNENPRNESDEHVLEDWRKLTTSDHVYYMCTKNWSDGNVHKYFSPYDSPYDAYINFMNVLDNVKQRVED